MSLAIYRKILEQMWADGVITPSELATLAGLQSKFNLSDQDSAEAQQGILGMSVEKALVQGVNTPTPSPAVREGSSADQSLSGPTTVPRGAPVPTVRSTPEGPSADQSLSGRKTSLGRPSSSAGDDSQLSSGMHLGKHGNYELLDHIAEGGMGTVWRAKDISLDGRIVAMKRIRMRDEADQRMVERFEQERKSVSSLSHANVVTVHDAGNDDYGPYLVMEFVEGYPLNVLLKKERLEESRAVAIFEGLCLGVAHAHKKGVMHRDIKPANVLLDGEGTPKLLDFGLARGAAGSELSMEGQGMGTLDYASPEQKSNAKSVDHRTDIYSLGATFYELLTGLRPTGLLQVSKVPVRWQAVVNRACELDRGDRYGSTDDLLAALEGARLASAPQAAAEVPQDGDDLRCPSCRKPNSVGAKHCKVCGEGLFIECPACSGELRAGLIHCEQCGALVTAVREAQVRLEAAREALEATRLRVAQREAKAGSEVLDGVRLGAAKDLLKELGDLTRRAADSKKLAAKHLKEAAGLEGRKKYEQALEKYKAAADLYDTHAQEASDAESRYGRLILVRDGADRLKEARAAEECGEYEKAIELYADAAGLDGTHQGELDRAQRVLPLWIALKATEGQAKLWRNNPGPCLDLAVKAHADLLQNAPFAGIEKFVRESSFPQDAEALQESAAGLRNRLDEIAEGLALRKGRDRLQAAREAKKLGRLGVALDETKAGLEVLDGMRLGKEEDDLRCPACQRMNALEARFCRGCGEGLQTGAAEGLLKELSGLMGRIADQEKLAAKHLKRAEELEGRREYEHALEKFWEAASLHDTHAQKASDAESRFRPLILVRDGARVLKKARAAGERGEYQLALQQYREAARLDDAHAQEASDAESQLGPILGADMLKEARAAEERGEYEKAIDLYAAAAELDELHQVDLERAQEVLPLWVALKAVEENAWALLTGPSLSQNSLLKAHAALLRNAPFAKIEKLVRESSFPQDAAALRDAAAGLRNRLEEIAEGPPVRKGQARLQAAREAMKGKRLRAVQSEAKAGSAVLIGVRAGAAEGLLKELGDLTRRAADQERLADKYLNEAMGFEKCNKYKQALEKYKAAANLHSILAPMASDAESRLGGQNNLEDCDGNGESVSGNPTDHAGEGCGWQSGCLIFILIALLNAISQLILRHN